LPVGPPDGLYTGRDTDPAEMAVSRVVGNENLGVLLKTSAKKFLGVDVEEKRTSAMIVRPPPDCKFRTIGPCCRKVCRLGSKRACPNAENSGAFAAVACEKFAHEEILDVLAFTDKVTMFR